LTADVVRNLDLQHLWTDLSTHDVPIDPSLASTFPFLQNSNLIFIQGRPPDKLYSNDPLDTSVTTDENSQTTTRLEWVLAARTESDWSVQKWVAVFNSLEIYTGSPVNRIVMALWTNDSTVVYYFVHSGLRKPRKN
ncbi:tRNA-splicing endonuclease subunit Sen15, partial [Lipomyces oligophaga]|uniref:tRNA-splicing endonuclease subunit Sen15 n=1 Tax=Lipomyces oligophaga TaxID=45792 RepID=UPI0034CDFE94